MEITRRYRLNVGTSVKGVKTYDCTVELTAPSDEPIYPPVSEGATVSPIPLEKMVLEESDALVAELDKRYPPPKE